MGLVAVNEVYCQMPWTEARRHPADCNLRSCTHRTALTRPPAEQLFWSHWLNNFATKAQNREAVAAGAMNLGKPQNLRPPDAGQSRAGTGSLPSR